MRPLFVLIANLLRLVLAAFGLPARLLRRRHRPEYVRFRLTGEPPYRPLERRGLGLFRPRVEPATVLSIEALREQLALLAADARVRGVVFEMEGLTIPIDKRQAFAELFEGFRKAGKEVIAYAVTASTSEYALMCAADRVWMAPGGRLDLTGLAVEATAIGRGLKWLGVSPQFVRRGDYKTAPELFTHELVSDIQRQTLETLLDEHYAALVEAIAKGRRLTEEQARKKIDEGPYSARRALVEGLCDALCSRARLAELLAYRAEPGAEPPPEEASGAKKGAEEDDDDDEESPRLGTFDAWTATLPFQPRLWHPLKRSPRLALVAVNGAIAEGGNGMGLMGRQAGTDSIARALRSAVRDPRARAILLYVNCPGGGVTASELALEEIRRAAKKKPVLAYFDQMAASGGYMAALGARELWTGPHAIVGSIGVFAGKFDLSGLMERLGIHRLVLTRGANAGLSSMSRPFTPHERAALEADMEDAYQSFLEYVAEARKLSKEEVHQRAEGRIFSGTAAARAGLVNGTCGFEEACRRALELAEVKDERFEVVSYMPLPRRLPLLRGLLQQAGAPRVYALWFPWFTLPGTGGAGEPG